MPNKDDPNPTNPTNLRALSRRQFLKGAAAVSAGTALAEGLIHGAAAEEAPLDAPPRGKTLRKGNIAITLDVNGKPMRMDVEPRTTLLDALRTHADPPLTGPKLVCDQGACGACTVMVDGKTAYACQLLAMDMVGRKVVTVEGLSPDGAMTPVQAAMVEHDALMCGFCTPGFVTSLTALLAENPNPTEDDVKHACAGNTCRCGTYPKIFEAALSVKGHS